MSKDPTPKTDALRTMREERYGHITARDAKPSTPKPAAKPANKGKKK